MKNICSILQSAAFSLVAGAGITATLPLRAAEPIALCAPDGKHTASANEHGRIEYREAVDNSVKTTFYACHVQALAFSNDGQLLGAVSGQNGNPGKIKIWRVKDGGQLCEISTANEVIKAIAISDNGRLVVGASSTGQLKAWRVADGVMQWTRPVLSPAQSIQFKDNGNRLVVELAQGKACFLDPKTGRNSSLETAGQ